METQTAKLNYLRIAPRKVRSVADLIRGLSVNEAEAQLLAQRRRPAVSILKLLRSAVANAKNKQLIADHLFIKEIRVDNGPMLKRFLPRARGSASPIQKKMSHVTIILGVNEAQVSKFKIVTAKKTKLPPSTETKRKGKKRTAPKAQADTTESPSKNKSGFFKKMFNRKTGMGS
jgi:large subunit ribosomal protein L22